MSDASTFKIVLLGDSGCGKSSLLQQYVHKQYRKNNLTSTVGVDLGTKTIHIQGRAVNLQIWDTAGQEAYHSICRNYYRSAMGAVIVFDQAERESFEHAKDWLQNVKVENPQCVCIVIGNKSDLGECEFEHLITEFCTNEGLSYVATSAKEYESVKRAFTALALAMFELYGVPKPSKTDTHKISLSPKQFQRKKCCP